MNYQQNFNVCLHFYLFLNKIVIRNKNKEEKIMSILHRFSLLVFLLLPASILNAAVEAPESIKSKGNILFCTELAYPPWEMIDPSTNEPDGFDVDMASALSNGMGVESKHIDIAFDGLIPALQAGQCDAIISGLANRESRREVVDFVDYAVAGNTLITRGNSLLSFNTLEDLSGKKVAVASGSFLEEELVNVNNSLSSSGKDKMQIVALQKGTDAFQQLLAGLADVYFGSTDQAGYYNMQNPGLVRIASPRLLTLNIGVATLHKDKDLHNAIKASFNEMIESGKYQEILDKWGFGQLTVN